MSGLAQLTPEAIRLLERLLLAGEIPIVEARRTLGAGQHGDAALVQLVQAGLARLLSAPDGTPLLGLGEATTLRRMAAAPGDASAQRLLRARMALQTSIGGPAADVVTITDLAELAERLQVLGREASSEVVSVHSGSVPEGPALEAHLASDVALVTRGVRVRVLYGTEAASSPQLRYYASTLSALGADIRIADAVPHRLVLFDRATAVVPLDRDAIAAGAAVVTDPSLVRRLQRLAETLLDNARPLEPREDDDPPTTRPPTPLERRVLHLMSSGITDDVAAAAIGVTDRTFRRYVAAIMTHLGATSRFQAGIRAIEHGWL